MEKNILVGLLNQKSIINFFHKCLSSLLIFLFIVTPFSVYGQEVASDVSNVSTNSIDEPTTTVPGDTSIEPVVPLIPLPQSQDTVSPAPDNNPEITGDTNPSQNTTIPQTDESTPLNTDKKSDVNQNKPDNSQQINSSLSGTPDVGAADL